MPFNSYGFIFILLPIILAGFYLLKRISGKHGGGLMKAFLILMSVVFFAQFGLYNVCVLAGSIAVNLVFLYLMGKSGSKSGSDKVYAAALIANVAALALFKYSGIAFPLAVSFYTFSQISMLCDYKKAVASVKDESNSAKESFEPKAGSSVFVKETAENRSDSNIENSIELSLLNYLLYILYFPKLLQGPIAKYKDMSAQFDKMGGKRFDKELFIRGFLLFAIGLSKKVLIADVLGNGTAYGFSNIGTLTSIDAILVVVAYALQLYFDFSSYCDLGEGVSMMLGIVLPVNFNSPYKADNFGEFWHRWHYTLTRFLTDYVYIPLGGSRKGEAKTYRNLFIVLILSGLWHGNTFVFLIWGVLNGIYTSLSRLILKKRKPKGIGHVVGVALTFCLWSLQSIFFNVKTLGEAGLMLTRFFSTKLNFLFATRDLLAKMVPTELSYIFAATPLFGTPWEVVVPCWLMIFICLVIVFFAKNSHEIAVTGKLEPIKTMVIAGLFVYSIMSLGNVSTFIYTNF